jgi:hypothetical protein
MTAPETALRLAGFALAHAAWSVEDGETLCTLAFVETAGERELARYEAPTIPDSLELAFEDLGRRLADGGHAALVFDGYATPEGGERTDALLAIVLGAGGDRLGGVVLRYVPARRGRLPFRRGRQPFRLLGPAEPTDELGAGSDAIVTEGMREHPQGARLLGTASD